MAIGNLASTTVSGTTANVYTVPAGVSHAVVHINMMTNGAAVYAKVNGNNIMGVPPASGGTYVTASVMLSAGDVVSVESAGGATGILISGYTVA